MESCDEALADDMKIGVAFVAILYFFEFLQVFGDYQINLDGNNHLETGHESDLLRDQLHLEECHPSEAENFVSDPANAGLRYEDLDLGKVFVFFNVANEVIEGTVEIGLLADEESRGSPFKCHFLRLADLQRIHAPAENGGRNHDSVLFFSNYGEAYQIEPPQTRFVQAG